MQAVRWVTWERTLRVDMKEQNLEIFRIAGSGDYLYESLWVGAGRGSRDGRSQDIRFGLLDR